MFRSRRYLPSLTPKEIAEGWLMLFEGESNYGWKGDTSTWTVREGTLEATGTTAARLTTTSEFADFELQFECQVQGKGTASVWTRNGEQELKLDESRDWVRYSVLVEGQKATARKNGRALKVSRGPRSRRSEISFAFNGKGTVRLRNIQLKPLNLKPLFNGKDLTGWKEIPDHKSVYSVTPEGWLNVKNGNGQLQSTAEFGDFILQLEIIANGTHLNSGVFFRETTGLFWNGYEAQIRNQWQGDDRTKAVDYGTGGIYNRQPARKVISSDREWFTMTVLATGKHLATWVNGYPIGDFIDERPEDQSSARTGSRTKAGVIGLQGHDPTTDLSFRNIRIVEYPAGK